MNLSAPILNQFFCTFFCCQSSDSDIDEGLFARISEVTADRELIQHDDVMYDVSPSQVLSLYDSSASRIFRIDSRTVANWDAEMLGFNPACDRIIRWSLFRGQVFPLRVRPTHNARRYPHLCGFVVPQDKPVKYLALESFLDAAQFQRHRSILHHTIRLMNLPEAIRERLERTQSLLFADSGTHSLRLRHMLILHCFQKLLLVSDCSLNVCDVSMRQPSIPPN